MILNIIKDFSRYGLEASEAKIADILSQLDLWVVTEEYMNVANSHFPSVLFFSEINAKSYVPLE